MANLLPMLYCLHILQQISEASHRCASNFTRLNLAYGKLARLDSGTCFQVFILPRTANVVLVLVRLCAFSAYWGFGVNTSAFANAKYKTKTLSREWTDGKCELHRMWIKQVGFIIMFAVCCVFYAFSLFTPTLKMSFMLYGVLLINSMRLFHFIASSCDLWNGKHSLNENGILFHKANKCFIVRATSGGTIWNADFSSRVQCLKNQNSSQYQVSLLLKSILKIVSSTQLYYTHNASQIILFTSHLINLLRVQQVFLYTLIWLSVGSTSHHSGAAKFRNLWNMAFDCYTKNLKSIPSQFVCK